MTSSGGLCQIVTEERREKVKGSLLCFSETHLHTHTSGYMSSNALAVSLHYELSQLWLGHLRLEVAIGVTYYIILWVRC